MENLIFSLNSTMPVFFTMVLGYVFRRLEWISEEFASEINTFVFRIALPVLLFNQLAGSDFLSVWDTKFVLYCGSVTLAGILLCIWLSGYIVKGAERGEFIQVSYRSSQALLAMAYISGLYENTEPVALMLICSVPLYNVAAVLVLDYFSPDEASSEAFGTGAAGQADRSVRKTSGRLLRTVRNVITNPLILFILLGIAWSCLRLPYGIIFQKTMTNLAQLATPLGLLGMGAGMEVGKVTGERKNVLIASAIKLAGHVALFLPPAVLLGFRNEQLATILVMLGAPATVSCYVMARSEGYEGALSSGAIVMTTLFSTLTLTMWLWLLRSLGLI